MDQFVAAVKAHAGDQPPHRYLGLTRRQLGILSGLVGAGAIGLACDGLVESFIEQIRNRPVRREVTSLPADHQIIESYASAIAAMQNLPDSDPRSWNRQMEIHLNTCRHQSWLTWPWHRAYLFYFEQICRELSGDDGFALPYWDWTANRRIPAVFWDNSSPLFHSNRVASQTSQLPDSTVGPNVIANALAPANFISFAGAAVPLNDQRLVGPGMGPLESGPHNGVHGFVGGTMSTFRSPLDPIFWLHHARLDQLWVEWNVTRENPNTNADAWTDTEFTEFFDRSGNPAAIRVSITILQPLLAYRYDTQEVA